MSAPNEPDIVQSLGELALGTRLKRLLERLNGDVARFYGLLAVDFKPSWFPVLYVLGTRSPLTVTGIAAAVGLTHPAVNKTISQMTRAGLVASSQYDMDKRKRLVDLTRKGRDVHRQLTPVWANTRAAVSDLLAESAPGFLESIDRIETALDHRSVYRRLAEYLKPRLLEQIEILDYAPALKKHFRKLNYDWLQEDHKVEPHDEAVLSDPDGQIIRRGGRIFFARLDGKIVGTCALIRHDDGTLEAGKLAVTKSARNRFVATRLALAVIDAARDLGAERLYAETDPNHPQAVPLAEHLGFRRVEGRPIPQRYERPCLAMVLDLREQR